MLVAHSKRGALIVFEGCDRAGKSTQVKKLVHALHKEDIKTEFMGFPDRTTALGKLIDDYLTKKIDLTNEAIHLLFSANRWELEPKINTLVNNGTTLIVDRYVYSGVAFSAAKQGMNVDWCKMPEAGLPKPDAVFFLTLSPEVIAKRDGFGDERYEVAEFQKNVMSNYLTLKDESWQVINADQDIETLHQDILLRALPVIKGASYKSLGQLW